MSNATLFAQLPGGAGTILVVIVVFVVMALLSFLILLAKQFKRCPSNRVLVIYGRVRVGGKVKMIHGGAAFVVPLIQDYAYLSLEPMDIEVTLKGVLSKDNIRVNVPGVFTVAIGTTPELMQNAAIRLLGLTSREIEQQASRIILGQPIASMRIEDINRDRDTFLAYIRQSLEPELRKIGLLLMNVNITDITDESGDIVPIDQKATVTALLRKLVDLLIQVVDPEEKKKIIDGLLEEGILSDEDREEIRRLLDAPDSLP